MSIPFHKQTDASKQAGQIVFDIPEQRLDKQETTLAQYIARKTDEPKKMTFEEWWLTFTLTYSSTYKDWAKEIWNAALKQGKL